jgi:cellulose synthase/poly-beta-1,6-N-acetylglucosamine synthase-like glycosyltransferase
MAAHNEEKIIRETLDNLLKLPYENYEVILGLDGCTDRTEEIVEEFCNKSNKFRYYKLNLRQGKPAVINSIIEHAKGDIVIINDADWLFKVKSRQHLLKFLSVFDNPTVGGIAESFAVEWDSEKLKRGNLGFKMVAHSSNLWFKYQKDNFAQVIDEKSRLMKIKEPTMFLTNIFRTSLFKNNSSLGDDFERTSDIMSEGYDIVLYDDTNMPRMTAVYDKISIKDLFKQKMRTAIAREQLKENFKMRTKSSYYASSVFNIFKKSWGCSLSCGFLISFWIFITATATILSKIKSKIKKTGTKEGWALRAKR